LIGGRSVDYVIILLLQIGSAVASLVLMSLGLAVIFGMMRVINLAHGEFLMLGGYAATFYLLMSMTVGRIWQDVDNGMMFVSLGVAACMIIALPWRRRVWDRSQPPGPDGEDVGALDTPISDHVTDEVRPESLPDSVPVVTNPPEQGR